MCRAGGGVCSRASSAFRMAEPAVRARHMKTFVETIGALEPPVRERIRARLPSEHVVAIDEAVPAVWLPMAINLSVTDAVSLELGPRDAHAFFRALVSAEYETDTFRAFLASVARLLGLTPTTYVKMAPRGWELVFKNCGALRPLARERHQAWLEYTNIPSICLQNDLWIESVRSSFYSAFDLTRVPGEIRWEELDFHKRRAVFRFVWG